MSCRIFWQVWQCVGLSRKSLVVHFAWKLFFEDYDVDALSDVFFWASYFGAVAYRGDFAFEEAGYAANC